MEHHISQTYRSHINMIENLYKHQLQQNEALQQKLNDAEQKLKAYREKFGELNPSNSQLPTNNSPFKIQPPIPAPKRFLQKTRINQNTGAIPKT